MSPDQKKLIIDFAIKKISKDQFLKSFPVNPEMDKNYVSQVLNESLLLKDTDEVECAMLLGFHFGFPEECAPVLCKLLMEDWHIMHEDIVSVFQHNLKYPGAVDNLYRTAFARFPYLNHDEFFGLARKCTWALADIGTPEAKEKLQELTRCENEVIAGYAQKRLDHWQEELSRKG